MTAGFGAAVRGLDLSRRQTRLELVAEEANRRRLVDDAGELSESRLDLSTRGVDAGTGDGGGEQDASIFTFLGVSDDPGLSVGGPGAVEVTLSQLRLDEHDQRQGRDVGFRPAQSPFRLARELDSFAGLVLGEQDASQIDARFGIRNSLLGGERGLQLPAS